MLAKLIKRKEAHMNKNHALVPVVQIVNNQAITTSTDVSRKFGKHHKHIMETIRKIEMPDDFRESNFQLISKQTPMPKGGFRDESMYNLTRDGFTILVMGFTGKRAMQFKIAYIEAFNRMEVRLHAKTLPAPQDNPMKKLAMESIEADLIHMNGISDVGDGIRDELKTATESLFLVQAYLGRILQDVCVLMPREFAEMKRRKRIAEIAA
jgi:Rha family phage regulatory protein